jgi:general secretion pathway protein K
VLFIIAMSFSLLIQSRIRRVEMLFQRFQARLEAYSALQYGFDLWLTGAKLPAELRAGDLKPFPDGNRYLLDGTPAAVPLFDRRPSLSFQDDGGLISLRAFVPELLSGLMRYFGATEDARKVFVDSLADWIDPDDLVRLNGAEKDYYAPLGYRPRNAPLLTIDEILMIRGMDESLFIKMRPFLFLGRSDGINPNTAPFEVLMSLPNMTDKAARQIMDFRKTGFFSTLAALSAVCGINFFFYERLFNIVPGKGLVIRASSRLGDDAFYDIICNVTRRFGSTTASDVPGAPPDAFLDESGRWIPYEIASWKEQIR